MTLKSDLRAVTGDFSIGGKGNATGGFTSRVVTLTDAATVTPNADTTDIGILTSLSQTTTFANPTGTPTNGQLLLIRITSSTARTIAFGTAYQAASSLVLPTSTTGASAEDWLSFRYNSTDSKWDFLGTTIGQIPTAADGSITPAKLSQPLTRATSINLSGTTIADWTSIPSWITEITLMIGTISTNGTSNLRVQLGTSGSPETSGYVCLVGGLSASSNNLASATAGFDIFFADASYVLSGSFKISRLTGNTWTFDGKAINVTTAGYIGSTSGAKTLAGTLDMIRLTTVSGNTFDSGSVANIFYQ